MNKITQFVMEDVRCFAGRQEFEIRPLTFLVGENSTGKSTALGCFQVLLNCLISSSRGGSTLDFNVAPYSMGGFNDIVSRKRPICEKLKLGLKFESNSTETIFFEIALVEKKQSAEPMLECINIKFRNGELCFLQNKTQEIKRERPFTIDTQNTDIRKNIFFILCDFDSVYHIPYYFDYFVHNIYSENWKMDTEEENALVKFLEKQYKRSNRELYYGFPEPFSFAPIRSRPKRTYDPTREFEDPEGSDVPVSFMRMKSSKSKQWEELQKQLVAFGKSSGLFERIEVKRHGKSMSDPFQIQVKVRGPKSNIMDVGYGVNQILPILVRIFSDTSPRFFLLQQPEVHLHPKGQAELASLFVNLIRQKKHSFIIETHSDYMVDRACIEIQKGNIKPEDVSLIYMEPKGAHVKVHNIGFDSMGNLKDVPKSYRNFFLKETDNLLGSMD